MCLSAHRRLQTFLHSLFSPDTFIKSTNPFFPPRYLLKLSQTRLSPLTYSQSHIPQFFQKVQTLIVFLAFTMPAIRPTREHGYQYHHYVLQLAPPFSRKSGGNFGPKFKPTRSIYVEGDDVNDCLKTLVQRRRVDGKVPSHHHHYPPFLFHFSSLCTLLTHLMNHSQCSPLFAQFKGASTQAV